VWVMQVRQGVHWQLVDSPAGRLVGGRELTADDIVTNFNRLITAPDAWIVHGQPQVATTASIEKTGPWEVTIRTPSDYLTAFSWLVQGSGFFRIYPPEVVEEYGGFEDWRNAVGTGPYMIVDYVPGSIVSFVRNPNYWERDPSGPGEGNQLPYPDKLRQLIIPDMSTTYAALRSGKIDLQTGVGLIDSQSLFKTNPEIESLKYLSAGPWAIAFRVDLPGKPLSDLRVRRALLMAIDFDSFVRDYYGGEAEADVWPVSRQVTALYQSIDEMPESVQELYRYDPEKAKELLAEAGYPDGFKTSVIIDGNAERIDELSIFKDMWAKVGVELDIDIKESGNYSRIRGVARDFEDMLYRARYGSYSIQIYFSAARSAAINNQSRVNDPPGSIPYVEDLYNSMNEYIFTDWPQAYEQHKKLKEFLLENAYQVTRPTPYTYNFWMPWLNNYYGQGTGLVRYAWIDEDMKESMGY
ncbi:MAG: ABC transporter substrate-binding protein, partial [Dehalococcoidales bacterium]